MTKRTVEECYVLTCGMVKDILLQGPGSIETYGWNRAGKLFFLAINVIDFCAGEALVFFHQNEAGHQFRRTVKLDWVPTSFGDRRYLLCPICSRHCNKLHCPLRGDVFACRSCWNLTYRSQQSRDAAFCRALERRRAIPNELVQPRHRGGKAKKLMEEYAASAQLIHNEVGRRIAV